MVCFAHKTQPRNYFFFFFENYFLFPFSLLYLCKVKRWQLLIWLTVGFALDAIWNNWAGKNKTRSYNNKQGNKHCATEIVGDEVILLDKKTE